MKFNLALAEGPDGQSKIFEKYKEFGFANKRPFITPVDHFINTLLF